MTAPRTNAYELCDRSDVETPWQPRWAPEGTGEAEREALNARIMHEVNATGEAFLSHTKLGERRVLRLAIGNIRTARRHVERAWELLRAAARAPRPPA